MASTWADTSKGNPKERLIIVLDDLDFSWTKKEINKTILLWDSGYSVKDMAQMLRPKDSLKNGIDEVALLIMHISRQGKIKSRQGGVFGNG